MDRNLTVSGQTDGPNLGPGWEKLAADLRDELSLLPGRPQLVVGMDSFGLVEFSVEGDFRGRDDVQETIARYAARALTVCERCGKAGTPRSGSLITVRCDTCG